MSPIKENLEKLGNKASVVDALNALKAQAEDAAVEPYLVKELGKVLEKSADKAHRDEKKKCPPFFYPTKNVYFP